MSSSTFEVKEPDSEKNSEYGLDPCEENGLEFMTNLDGEVPRDHTYNKEPTLDQEDSKNDSEEHVADNMDTPSPKKKGRNSAKVKKEPKKSLGLKLYKAKKATKEPVKKQVSPKKGKKKENLSEESTIEVEESLKTEEEPIEVSEPVHETPKSTKRGKKRKVEEKENVIDQSIVDEIQNITEDTGTSNNTEPEGPSKKKVAKKDKTPVKTKKTAAKPAKTKSSPADVIEDTTNLPKGWVKKLVVRKSGKSAGAVDVYIYSPDGLKFRSKPDVAAFLQRTKSPLKLDDFDFSKKKVDGPTLSKTPAKAKVAPVKSKAAPTKSKVAAPKSKVAPTKPKVNKKKTGTQKKKPKLLVKIGASKKNPGKAQKSDTKEDKQSNTTVKEKKAKGTPKGNKKKTS